MRSGPLQRIYQELRWLERTTGFEPATLTLAMCLVHRHKSLTLTFAIVSARFAVLAGSCSPKSVGKMLARSVEE
jgi:hypothetical protein